LSFEFNLINRSHRDDTIAFFVVASQFPEPMI